MIKKAKKSKVVFMNKNYRLLSFKSFFIFIFFRRVSPWRFFRVWGERLKILYSRRVIFYIQIFSLFLFLHFFTFFTFFTFSDFFTFLHFYNFQIFSLFYIFTFLQFFRGHSSRCFFLCGEMLKNFLGGCAGLDYFLKKWGVAQTGPTALLLTQTRLYNHTR